MRALLRRKADNILSSLGWVMTNGIRATPHVLLNDSGANLNEDAESLRGCMLSVRKCIFIKEKTIILHFKSY